MQNAAFVPEILWTIIDSWSILSNILKRHYIVGTDSVAVEAWLVVVKNIGIYIR